MTHALANEIETACGLLPPNPQISEVDALLAPRLAPGEEGMSPAPFMGSKQTGSTCMAFGTAVC